MTCLKRRLCLLIVFSIRLGVLHDPQVVFVMYNNAVSSLLLAHLLFLQNIYCNEVRNSVP